jgi:hypothetical protein
MRFAGTIPPPPGAAHRPAADNALHGAAMVWEKGEANEECAMRSRILVVGLALALTGCGSGTGRLSGGAAGGAATGAVIGLLGGPIGVVLGAGIGAGAGAMASSNTTPKQVDLGPPPWGRAPASAQQAQAQPPADQIQPQQAQAQPAQLRQDPVQQVQAQPLQSPR